MNLYNEPVETEMRDCCKEWGERERLPSANEVCAGEMLDKGLWCSQTDESCRMEFGARA